jgi:PadR family transcriptional regulator PadR
MQSGMLETFDEPFDGRNRRYYKITDQGEETLEDAVGIWHSYKKQVEELLTGKLLTGGIADDQE